MSTLSFVKYQGIGNDFIVIDGRDLSRFSDRFDIPFFPLLVPRLCDRKLGIGADGVLVLEKGVDFRMRVFNSDGSEAESCGNGLRCFVLFLHDLGIQKELYQIQVGPHTVFAKWEDDQIAVDMGEIRHMQLHLPTQIGPVHFADSGVPHVVQFVLDVEKADLFSVSSVLRFHPLFGLAGANVNIAAVQADGSIRVRTFERGVEAETLGCGTAAMAVASIAQQLYSFKVTIPVHFRGGTLSITQNWMKGPAQKVFSGVIKNSR